MGHRHLDRFKFLELLPRLWIPRLKETKFKLQLLDCQPREATRQPPDPPCGKASASDKEHKNPSSGRATEQSGWNLLGQTLKCLAARVWAQFSTKGAQASPAASLCPTQAADKRPGRLEPVG